MAGSENFKAWLKEYTPAGLNFPKVCIMGAKEHGLEVDDYHE